MSELKEQIEPESKLPGLDKETAVSTVPLTSQIRKSLTQASDSWIGDNQPAPWECMPNR